MSSALALLLALPACADAATITVTTEDDLLAAGGPCSLREAIQAANTDAVSGGCAAGSGPDTIQIPAGTFGLTRGGAGENADSTGDLDITTGEVTIAGAGSGVTVIDGRGIDRVLNVLTGATAALRDLTVTGGRAPDGADGEDAPPGSTGLSGSAGGSSIGGAGAPGQDGGGILSLGTLTVDGVVVTRNQAGRGGDGGDARDGGNGGDNIAGSGGNGGPSVRGTGSVGGSGGGIAALGPLTITNSTVSDNRTGDGGDSGDSGNGGDGGSSTGGDGAGGHGGASGAGASGFAGNGGGVLSAGALTVSNSTIAGNRTGDGGDLGSSGTGGDGGSGNGSAVGGFGGFSGFGITGDGGAGGGIFHTGPTPVTITTSTISNNVTGRGGDQAGSLGNGGNGGMGGAGTGGGGSAGLSGAETTGNGGAGGGISTGDAVITSTTVSGNRTGRGGFGTPPGSGGVAGGSGGGGGFAGSDGISGFGVYGNGGHGGNVFVAAAAAVAMTDVTITSGSTGDGAPGQPGGPGPSASGGSGAGSGGSGGGVFASVNTTMTNVTISNNSTGAGGAAGTAGTGAGATPPSAGAAGIGPGVSSGRLQATIVAGNAGTAGCAGATADLGGNVSFPDNACPGTVADPVLGTLAMNGGPTPTRALGAGSGAINLVDPALCPVTDQRGVARPQNGLCDAGSYEVAPPAVTTGGTSELATTTATLTGMVNPNARPATYRFEFGPTTAYGSSTPDTSAGGGLDPVDVEAAIASLTPGTTIHYRLVATNADGTTAGADQTVSTPAFGVEILTGKARLKNGQVPVNLRCPAAALDLCAGTLKLAAKVRKGKISAKTKKIALGKAKFGLDAGETAKFNVKIKPAGLEAIADAGKKGLASTATATASDAAANQGTTKRKLKIKPG